MRRLLLGIVLLMMLIGCQQSNNINVESHSIDEIITYDEVIEDGRVEIDGIYYNIMSVSKITYKYDDSENVMEKIATNDDSKMRIEFLYENNQLIEDRVYSNDELSSTSYYYYEDDLLMQKKIVSISGLEIVIEYSYGNKTKTQTHYNSDGKISFIATSYIDDDGKVLKGVITTADEEVTDLRTFYYDNELLTKVIIEEEGSTIKTFNYEYNNIGDVIMEYIIFYGDSGKNMLLVNFYDYEYNEDLLPKTVTIHRVQSQIANEDIRDFQ